jgi:hypothetical protein
MRGVEITNLIVGLAYDMHVAIYVKLMRFVTSCDKVAIS